MNKFLLAIILMFCFVTEAISQDEKVINDSEKYKQFGLVWGLLKYHHPKVSNGEYNWDKIFIENIDKLENVKTQINLNHFLLDFILSIQPSKIRVSNNIDNLFKDNYDYDWIELYSSNKNLYSSLKRLRDNANIKDYYVSYSSLSKVPTFKNEIGFKSFDHKIRSHRLLTVFSFWNVIQYNYVNKYLIGTNWLDQLDVFVSNFLACNSKLEYEKLKSKLIASINDSHAYYLAPIVVDSLFKYKPPFRVKVVNDTLVVTAIFNKKLCENDDLRLGDLIVEVRDMNIKHALKERVGSMISSSNPSFLKKWARWLFFYKKDSIKVKIKRGDTTVTKYLHLYNDLKVDGYSSLKSFSIKKKWQLIDNEIGYINLKSISKNELKKAFKELSNTIGIVIDLRNYPKNILERDIANYIYPDKRTFIKVLFPLKNRPSLAKFSKSPISFIKDPFKTGNKNSKYYNKKIILLVNHSTQSKAEYIGMAIQTSPNCITIGENTAGSVMNIATFTLPDKTKVNFTSLGAFYPNGIGTQKKGLKIDYFINENTSNFLKDQYIIKGIKLIKSKNTQE